MVFFSGNADAFKKSKQKFNFTRLWQASMHEWNVAVKMLQVQVFGINGVKGFGAEVLEVAVWICDDSVNWRTFSRRAFYFHGICVSWNIIFILKTRLLAFSNFLQYKSFKVWTKALDKSSEQKLQNKIIFL